MPLFDFDSAGRRQPKTYVHVGHLPAYIQPEQSLKKSPWRTITDAPFLKSVNVILPEELYDVIWDKIEDETKKASYAKVILKLQDVLHGAFFTEHIKKGKIWYSTSLVFDSYRLLHSTDWGHPIRNVLMLSEGRPGIDNFFSLRDGVLRLELDKESYERCGLQGQPAPSGGRKHMKARYLIEIELRKPSMLHGKKGFERLVYAAKNVLNQSLTWLFCDLSPDKGQAASSPLDHHRPTTISGDPLYGIFDKVLSPPFSQFFSNFTDPTVSDAFDEETIYDIIEWLGLVVLKSPRVLHGDNIDPYLSRYTPPEGSTEIHSLRIIKWEGLISAEWMMRMLNTCIRQSRVHSAEQWLAISASAHHTEIIGQHDGFSIILLPEPSSPQEPDVNVDAESGESRLANQGARTRSSNVKLSGGLQKCICFEHVDSVVGS